MNDETGLGGELGVVEVGFATTGLWFGGMGGGWDGVGDWVTLGAT